MNRDRERLGDALEAITLIQSRTACGRQGFERDELLRVWCLYHLRTLGEAVRCTSRALRQRCPDFPWDHVTGMRILLDHGSVGIDPNEVWATVERDLPGLKAQIEEMLGGWGPASVDGRSPDGYR